MGVLHTAEWSRCAPKPIVPVEADRDKPAESGFNVQLVRTQHMMKKSYTVAGLVVSLGLLSIVTPSGESLRLGNGWNGRDIGAFGQPGSATESSGTWTVSGAGADIWNAADAFHFAYRPIAGDVTIVARVASIQGAERWTKVGVMIRATTKARSAHALMLVSTAKGLAFQRRTSMGARSTHTTGGAGTAPSWVKLTRTGSVITASVSADGRRWTVVGQDTFSMPSTVLVGLAVTSHNATRLATGTFDSVAISVPSRAAVPPRVPVPSRGAPRATGRLQVAPDGRFLQHRDNGRHFLYLADTAWALFRRLSRSDADLYLRDVANKGFTAVMAVALWEMNRANAYGDRPLGQTNGRWDPNKILTTPGNDPASAEAYDYWDHMDYILDKAEEHGLYVALQPTWGNYVSGTTSWARQMSSNVFTVANARTYGEFIGRRYGHRPNIIWMLGGDRAPVYSNGDFRSVWRSMAEGIGRGVTGQALNWNRSHAGWNALMMTYHGNRWDAASSTWFHTDPWLDFNGIHAEYNNIVTKMSADWHQAPAKPALVFETRYENEMSTDRILFRGAFKQRYQLYHAILAGSLGYAYGHKSIWRMDTEGGGWRAALNAPGRTAMQSLRQLMDGLSNSDLLDRVPDQTLVDGPMGSAEAEDLLVAMRGADRRFALVYSTNGRNIRLKLAQLAAGRADAFWFSPRTGRLHDEAGRIASGPFATFATREASIRVFNPPGAPEAGNDWVLKVVVRP